MKCASIILPTTSIVREWRAPQIPVVVFFTFTTPVIPLRASPLFSLLRGRSRGMPGVVRPCARRRCSRSCRSKTSKAPPTFSLSKAVGRIVPRCDLYLKFFADSDACTRVGPQRRTTYFVNFNVTIILLQKCLLELVLARLTAALDGLCPPSPRSRKCNVVIFWDGHGPSIQSHTRTT